ncbi:MAG: UDP-glucose 4-epimerase GalE [Balneola sp.]|nr:UDP-glucose 4-epimerase GalE [Balneola sp.]|tara:strand:+ start:25569 stop:26582 length:1014 start_codon:yes stop_codon:yes gene_type:complete
MKRILVTGATGFIGSHTLVELIDRGYSVIGIDNLANSSLDVLNRIKDITGIRPEFREGDIRDKEFLNHIFQMFEVDSVIHFAGYKAVDESVREPMLYYSNNLIATQLLLEAMQKNGIKKLIFSSSCTVYGDSKYVPITEESETCPVNPYGRTKYYIENMLRDLSCSDSHWKILNLRYFNPVGAHPTGLIGEDPLGIPNNLFPFLTQTAIGKRDAMLVFGSDYDTPDGTCIRDYIHVVDLAKGHLAALEALDNIQGINFINLGTGNGSSVLEIVNTFKKVNDVEFIVEMAPRRKGDAAKVWADTTKAKKVLKWKSELTLEDMLRDAWNWQQKNPNGYI